MKTPVGKPLHSAVTNTCLLYQPSLSPFPPCIGIISRCLIERIQVVSDSAIETSWFWFASRIFSIDSSTALWGCLKITMNLRGIEPTPEFSSRFRFKLASSDQTWWSSFTASWSNHIAHKSVKSLLKVYLDLKEKINLNIVI